MARSQSPDFRDFWQEYRDIESNKEHNAEEEETAKTPDAAGALNHGFPSFLSSVQPQHHFRPQLFSHLEGEQEAAWLKEAGYGFVVSQYNAGKELSEDDMKAMTESLPSNHAAVIKKRVDTLNATLRKKQKYTTKIDVRNIFPEQRHSAVVNSDSDSSKAPQSAYRPATLPHGMKLLTVGNDHSWIKQTKGYSSTSRKIPVQSLFSGAEKRQIYLPEPQYQLSEVDLSSENDIIDDELADSYCDLDLSLPSNKRVRNDSEEVVMDPDLVIDPDQADAVKYERSASHELGSGSPCLSPARSKSSSCNTLDSIDSGLESSTSNKDHTSSQDSLDGISLRSYLYELGQFTHGDERSEGQRSEGQGHIVESCSPPAHYSVVYEDNEPPLVAYRKRRKSHDKSPRSPTSPRQEVIHPEWAANRPKNRASFMKNKGGYSMSGVSEEVIDNAELGVEMLSMQQKAVFQGTNSQLSPISDTDITFEFTIEENGTHGGLHHEANERKDSLPNFRLTEDKLGITHIEDISEADIEYVRKLGLLELTSLFDSHNITYSARRAKKKHKENGIFGVPLDVLMEHDQKRKSNAKIPLAFQAILSYLVKYSLDTEGILRIPGLTTRVKQLRIDLEEKFYQGLFIWGDECTPNDVAGVMKQFLRDLPTPLLTNEYIDAFAQIESLPEKKQQLHALNLLILLLPTAHRNTLYALLLYLDKVISFSSVNKMGLNNVAMIMAPNLFMTTNLGNKQKNTWDLEIRMASGTSNIMKMLIKYREILWTVPSYLMLHVRRQYELEQIRKNKDKSKTKFLAKKDKTDVYKKPAVKHESDFQDGVIRVYAPHLTKSCTAVQLDLNTTAGDIVSKFKVMQGSQTWDPRRNSQHQKFQHGQVSINPAHFLSAGDNTYLYEVGGNIGERRLPNDTNMAALYKTNPNAEWTIKQRDNDVFVELFS